MRVTANYYDGLNARRYSVELELQNGLLLLHGENIRHELKPEQYKISNRLGSSPRVLLLNNGARCEISDSVAFEQLLAQLNHQPSLVAHLELSWHFVLAIALITLALLTSGYFFGLPLAAEKIAYRISDNTLVLIDKQLIKSIDDELMQPSKLAPARQQAILKRLQMLKLPSNGVKPRQLLFRASPLIGANAFTLPGGTIIVLDELVMLSKNDAEIIAVLAHELGHVTERHALRQILQASVVGVMVGWLVGDISSIIAIAPATLLETRYSRDFERRADNFAAEVLKLNSIPPRRLFDILKRLEQDRSLAISEETQHLTDFFSTHPATSERERILSESYNKGK